jgi:hypothetical protein
MLGGKELSGITSVISRQLFPNKYRDVPEYVLKKAAERGTMIHSICELVDDMGISHDSDEAQGYKELKDDWGLRYECSEYLVSDNEHYASCIDKVYRENETDFTLGDIKTTYVLDKESVRWQLSIYAYLFELQNPGCKAVRLIGIWLRGKNHEIVEVERIPSEVVVNLLKCDSEGRQFVNPYSISPITLPDEYRKMERTIQEIVSQAKYWSDKKKEIADAVMMSMVEAGEYSWKGDIISFTRKKDTIRKDFDKKAFEKDYPDLYNKYLKDIPVVGSVTLKTI